MTAEADRRGAIAEAAPAKINLYLHITGRRGDGYHLLDSLVVFPELGDGAGDGAGDELRFLPAEGLALTVSGPFADKVPAGADNLALAAARRLAAATGVGAGAGAAMALRKNLPVAAGLGGGSADAAACLRGLQRLWGLALAPGELHELAASLGADVPVCLASQPAWLGGIGEQLRPARGLPALALLLLNPGVALSTPKVFAARRGAFQTPAGAPPAGAGSAAFASWLGRCENGLEAAALALAPAAGAALAALRAQAGCLLARLCGSGATCYGLFAEPAARDLAAVQIARAEPGWWLAPATCPAVD